MSWKKTFIEEYAGHPLRVGLNLFLMGAGGILFGHYALGAPLNAVLVIGAMIPALVAIVAAGLMKSADQPPRR